jgi:hypothetical protein
LLMNWSINQEIWRSKTLYATRSCQPQHDHYNSPCRSAPLYPSGRGPGDQVNDHARMAVHVPS